VPELSFTDAELDRLADVLADRVAARLSTATSMAAAYTPKTLAAELGRTERSIRAAIARGELQAVKRGRGYVISADAVAEWARAPIPRSQAPVQSRNPRRRPGLGPAARALRHSP
jgi:excisionase family DNA binding protein